jgi:HPt (histidine-containing phosphotransfer) domain-containing protein
MASGHDGQTPSRPIASCLDGATLRQLLDLDDGQTGLLIELFGLFKDDSPERIENLKRSMAAGDASATSELAHAMKGAAGTIGASRMRALAQDIEKAGKAGRVDAETLQWLAELEAAYAEACAALDAFIGQG